MIESLWLAPALTLNSLAMALVFALSWLVLKRHPEPYFRWWVWSEGWRSFSAVAGTLFFFYQSLPYLAVLSITGMTYGSLGLWATARAHTSGTAPPRHWWWGGHGFLALSIGLTAVFQKLPEIFYLPAFLLLGIGHLMVAASFWKRRAGELRGLGALTVSIGSGIFGVQSLCYPVILAVQDSQLATLTVSSSLLCVTVGMGMIIHMLEVYHRREQSLRQQFHQTNQELVRTLEALHDSRTEAQVSTAVAREQEALVRQIVHDLRNSTQAIGLITESLEIEAGDQPRLLHHVAAIDRQVTFISHFLKEKLAWIVDRSRRDGQGTEVQPVLEALSACFEPIMATRAQVLAIETPPVALPLRVSSVELEQILGNLLRNAHQHTPERTRVRLWLAVSDGWATFYVADDGPGIPLEKQAMLGRSIARPDGTGVGLRNVFDLVTRAGGSFGFVSEEENGSTFYVTLPLMVWGHAGRDAVALDAIASNSVTPTGPQERMTSPGM